MELMHLAAASGLMAGLLAIAALPNSATGQDRVRTISVSGEGVVTVAPDQAILRFGVVTKHENPEEARARNAEASRDAMNAIRELGVEERHLRLETLRLEEEREYNQQTRQYVQIGFQAIRDIRVTLEDLDLLPTVVAKVVQQGANRLHGITYDLIEREAVRNEALRVAALNARKKAALLAEALGADLGQVLTINEQGVHVPRPEVALRQMNMSMRTAADAAPEPDAYASGEIEVRANVTVVFAIE